MKTLTCLLLAVVSSSLAQAADGGDGKAGQALPLHGAEVLKSSIDSRTGTGYAILGGGRLLHYQRWLTEDSSAFEATVIDTNRAPDEKRDWFSDDYVRQRVLWLSRLVLSDADNGIVTKAFKERKYQKELQGNGDIVFRIPGTNYSEFYFAVRRPADFIEDASVKVRYVSTL